VCVCVCVCVCEDICCNPSDSRRLWDVLTTQVKLKASHLEHGEYTVLY